MSLKETGKKLAPVARQQVKTATARGRSGAVSGSRKESGSLGLRTIRAHFPSGIPEGWTERFSGFLWDPGEVTPGFFRFFVVPGFGAALSGPVRAFFIDRVPRAVFSVRAYRSHLAFRRPREAGGDGGYRGATPPGSCGCHRRRPSREGGPTVGGDPTEAPHGPAGDPPAYPVLFFSDLFLGGPWTLSKRPLGPAGRVFEPRGHSFLPAATHLVLGVRLQVKTATARGRSGAVSGSRKESGSLGLRTIRAHFPSGIPEGWTERFSGFLWDPGEVTPGFFRFFVVPGFGAALSGPVRAFFIDRVPRAVFSVRAYRSHLAFRRPREAGGDGGYRGATPPGSCGCHRRRPSREGGPTVGGDPTEAPHGPAGDPPAYPVLFFSDLFLGGPWTLSKRPLGPAGRVFEPRGHSFLPAATHLVLGVRL
ncbi:hypothetical protein ES705_46496 [subsurface metagenome]